MEKCMDVECAAESGRAGHWGHMQCRDLSAHGGHNWSSEFTIYGPYHCAGVR